MTRALLAFCTLTLALVAGSLRADNLPAPAPVAPPRHGGEPAHGLAPRPHRAPVAHVAPPSGPLPTSPNDDGVVIVEPGEQTAVPGGASVGGVSVYGLTDLAAYQLLRATLGPQLGVGVTVSDGHRQWVVSRAALGAVIPYRKLMDEAHASGRNVPLHFDLDRNIALRMVQSLAAKVQAQPVDGMRAQVAVQGSVQRIAAALLARPARSTLSLVVARLPVTAVGPPPGTEAGTRFPYLLAAYFTRFDPSVRGRTRNLRIAARHVDGTVVAPGAVFSANGAIGRRDDEGGWREAKMFVNGQVVSGVGAGICQCSSTIYNAALLAGFPIVERHPHMFRVSYVPASRDATIYWGSKDMRFRNSSPGPLLVRSTVEGRRFAVRLWGTLPMAERVQVTSRIISRSHGTRSECFRTIADSAGTRRQRLSLDFYRPHP